MEQLLQLIRGSAKKGATILELGCGNGHLINAVAKRLTDAEKIIAVDLYNEPKQLNPKVEFIRQDLEQFDIPGTFDLVILNQVLEHIRDPLGLLTKIQKKLNSHGKILIIVPNRRGFGNEARVYFPEHGKHYWLWDVESLQFGLERLGFACYFHNRYTAGSHNILLRYIPMLLRLENPNITCLAMKED